MRHFTPKFQKAWERVQELAATGVSQKDVQLKFRDEMLALGHAERIRNLYRVQDKRSKKAVFFVPNAPQLKYMKTHSLRDIILKCRQVGFTTLNCIRALDMALWEANTRTGILCHKMTVVRTIFNDITKFCYNWFVRDWGSLYNPTRKQDSSTALSFADDGLGRSMESSTLVLHDFRGKTIHFLHVSEAARVDEPRLVGSLNGVPENGEAALESTAWGRQGEFYRLWQIQKQEEVAPYKGFFVPWYEYYPEVIEDWEQYSKIELTAREQELLKLYEGKIAHAHLMWRRWCIQANCAGNEDRFEQEYPTNDEDCFSTGEAVVFPYSIIRPYEKFLKEPIRQGFLTVDNGKVGISDAKAGTVAVWALPEPSHTYSIGADPAGGVGKDRAAAYVLDQSTGHLVARIWANLLPEDFAHEVYKLALFYNKAWICPEVQNHGHLVIHVLTKESNYRNVYRRQVMDEATKKPTTKLGFLTSNQSKLMITENLKSAIRTGEFIITDRELINEMTTFLQMAGKSGNTLKREAMPGAHDDLIMAAALAHEMSMSRNVKDSYGLEEINRLHSRYSIDPETGFYIGEQV